VSGEQSLVVALCGGIGGAKLALGLSRVLPPGELLVAVNTGDDFEHLGLCISPDLDTVMYTLAGEDNPETGWGRRGETWAFMDALGGLGGETWFRLGDRDLATHVERTRRLRAGEPLSAVTADFCRRFGIGATVLPMTDDTVRTRVRTDAGWLDFQDYFVRRRATPAVREIAFAGAAVARGQPRLLDALQDPRLRAVLICPSNPFISIGPILAVPAIGAALAVRTAPVVAVAPIIGGRAVKGPTAKMMAELGIEPSALAVARHYRDLLDGYVLDQADAAAASRLALHVAVAPTLMTSLADREALARITLDAADAIRRAGPMRSGR
jgi:LPPG:FO 2-phospho-L-lactate transferase